MDSFPAAIGAGTRGRSGRAILMKAVFRLLLVCLSWSCVNFANGQLLVAHRGASHEAPENTIASFQLAWEQGADAIEADFYLTADRRIACIHDSSTERVSEAKLPVAKTSLAELKQLDVGSWKGPQFAGERHTLSLGGRSGRPRRKDYLHRNQVSAPKSFPWSRMCC